MQPEDTSLGEAEEARLCGLSVKTRWAFGDTGLHLLVNVQRAQARERKRFPQGRTVGGHRVSLVSTQALVWPVFVSL